MNFEITTLPHKETLGEKLTRARMNKGFDPRYIESETKIRAKYIEALESGNYKNLPPDVYVRGFLRNYADFLGLDKNMILKEYVKERGLEENVKKIVERRVPKRNNLKSPRMVITPRAVFFSAISVVALLIMFYIGWQIKILAAPPKLSVSSPSNDTVLDSDSTYVEGRTDAGADVLINGAEVGVSPEGNFKEKIGLQDGVNTITIVAKNKIGKEIKIVRNTVVSLKPVIMATAEQSGVELKVSAGPNTAWIYVEVDGVATEKGGMVILSGASRVFKGKEKIVLTTKNAGSTNITFNGKDIGVLGKEGETVKNREFTKDMKVQ